MMLPPADRFERDLEQVKEALRVAQHHGMLGDRPIDEVVDHAQAFVQALADVTGRVIDLGTGGGVPGLVIMAGRPGLHVTLLDRRTARTDLLERAIRRYGFTDRATVVASEARHARQVLGSVFDAVVARGFGPPLATLRLSVAFLRPGGRVVISAPPGGRRWDASVLAELGLVAEVGHARVDVFVLRTGPVGGRGDSGHSQPGVSRETSAPGGDR
jgi:16S rRNA (guanine527-N7)-methyltransferase